MSDWEAEGYLEICGESILSLLRTWQPRSLATETIGTRSSLSDRAQELSEQVFVVEMGEARTPRPAAEKGQPPLGLATRSWPYDTRSAEKEPFPHPGVH